MGAEKDEIVSHVYRGIFPSRFIGGFVQFLKDHISDPYCRNLIKTSFKEFVERNLKLYKISGKTEIVSQDQLPGTSGISLKRFSLKMTL